MLKGYEGDRYALENLIDEVASLQKELTKALVLGLDYKRDGKKTGADRVIEKFIDAAAIMHFMPLWESDDFAFDPLNIGMNERVKIRQDRMFVEIHFKTIGWGNIPLNQFSDVLEILKGLNWLLADMLVWFDNDKSEEHLPIQKYVKYRNGFILKMRKIKSDLDNGEGEKDWVIETVKLMLSDFSFFEMGYDNTENVHMEALTLVMEFIDACAHKYTKIIQSVVADINDRMINHEE